VAHGTRPHRCAAPGVFVDEMGTHTSLAPLHAYAPIGERAFFEIPRNRGKNTTLLTSLHVEEGMGPSMAVEGATTARLFETYVRRLLAPALSAPVRSWWWTKHLGAHRPRRVRELVEERGDASSSTCHRTLRISNGMRRPRLCSALSLR
jgi:hypothetical protein